MYTDLSWYDLLILRGETCEARAICVDLPQSILTRINANMPITLILDDEEETRTGIADYPYRYYGLFEIGIDGIRRTTCRRLHSDTAGTLSGDLFQPGQVRRVGCSDR